MLNFENIGNYGEVRDDGRLYGYANGVAGHPQMAGYTNIRGTQTKQQRKRVMEATRLYADCLEGREDPFFIRQAMNPTSEVFAAYLMEKYPGLYGFKRNGRGMGLRETMSFSDYQALYVDVLDRMYYGFYNGFPVVNKSLVRIHKLRDFRLVSRYLLDGVVTPLTAMDAAAPPPQRALLGPSPQDGSPATSTAPIQYQPKLYQAMTSVNWRAFVNDDLGIFQDLAKRLAIAGNRGISKFITTLYMSSTGPNPALYQSGYRNQIVTAFGASSNNPALSSQGIMDGIKILSNMRDSGGDPILVTGKTRLWYGPTYTAVAENLMSATRIMLSNEGGTANVQGFPTQFVETANWLVRNMELVMDPYIPIVCTASGIQNTAWGITVDPDSQNRPCIEVGFLSGYEEPQIFTKVPNTQRMGGAVDPMMGDFLTLDQDMKIVTVFGGTQIDGRSAVASSGSGTIP